MTPAALLERIETLRLRTDQTVAELRRLISDLPAYDGIDRPDNDPIEIMGGRVGGELDSAADLLEDALDYLTARGEDRSKEDRDCCAMRALRSLVVTTGGIQ